MHARRSVMTLTSIGYGAMTPVNTAERVLCSVYMFASGFMWTFAIGSVAAIATTLDPNSVIFHNNMDSLNCAWLPALPAPIEPSTLARQCAPALLC